MFYLRFLQRTCCFLQPRVTFVCSEDAKNLDKVDIEFSIFSLYRAHAYWYAHCTGITHAIQFHTWGRFNRLENWMTTWTG